MSGDLGDLTYKDDHRHDTGPGHVTYHVEVEHGRRRTDAVVPEQGPVTPAYLQPADKSYLQLAISPHGKTFDEMDQEAHKNAYDIASATSPHDMVTKTRILHVEAALRPDVPFTDLGREPVDAGTERHLRKFHESVPTPVETKSVPIHQVHPGQSNVDRDDEYVRDEAKDAEEPPRTKVLPNGHHQLLNGHHRFADALERGDSHFTVKTVSSGHGECLTKRQGDSCSFDWFMEDASKRMSKTAMTDDDHDAWASEHGSMDGYKKQTWHEEVNEAHSLQRVVESGNEEREWMGGRGEEEFARENGYQRSNIADFRKQYKDHGRTAARHLAPRFQHLVLPEDPNEAYDALLTAAAHSRKIAAPVNPPGTSDYDKNRLHELVTQGGFSAHPWRNSPRKGFMASLDSKIAPGAVHHISQITPEHIAAHRASIGKHLMQPGVFQGGWHDTQTGDVYLDTSSHFSSEHHARAFAAQHKQKAYYNLGTGQEHFMDPHQDPQKHEDRAAWSDKYRKHGFEPHPDYASYRHLYDTPQAKTAKYDKSWRPHQRLFGPCKDTEDPRLFTDHKMLPEVREHLLAKLDDFMAKHGGEDWRSWARMYLAGSEASLWWGNNDFDILVGVHYDAYRKETGKGGTNEEITDAFNKAFRAEWNDENWRPPFDDEVWHLTGYVNLNSYDIRKIKPYAAYDVGADDWAVHPVHVPKDWGPDKLPDSVWHVAEQYADEIDRIADLTPASVQQQQADRLYNYIHDQRSRAFGPNGSGVFDTGNVAEKYLDQRPDHPLALLVEMKNQFKKAEQKTAKTDYANETPEDKAARRADWKKKRPDVPEVPNAPKGAHTAFRGIHLGGSNTIHGEFDPTDQHAVMAKVLDHTQHFRKMHDWPHDPSDPYAHRQQVFGTHWSTDHETARRFAIRTVENQDRGIPNYNHRPNKQPVHGVVFEARMHEPAKEEEFHRGYGEKEVRIPSRHQIHTLIAHVHTLHPPADDNESMHDSLRRTRDTHVHSFIVPDRHWRTALKTASTPGSIPTVEGNLLHHPDGPDWHHGTPHDFPTFDHEPETDEDWEHHEADIERHDSKHWNTFLGTHWTSNRDTARTFARGLHHNKYTGKGVGSIHTANLGITNPVHFHEEEDMDAEAFDHHWDAKTGHHDREDPFDYHGDLCHQPGCHVADHGDDDVAEEVRGNYKGGNEAAYLQRHPYKEEIATSFRQHLQAKGHDGITYGNAMPDEGPVGHPCAITFSHDQILNHRRGEAPGIGKGAKKSDEFDPPTVSGIALRAADTGRLLMIQRSCKDEKDPAAGTWEFPGGHHEDGDTTSLHAGIREWEEEVGHKFPEGGTVVHTWRTGPYQGHMVVIPSEDVLDLSQGRCTDNPDDPDCDDHEQSAWWDPEHAKKNPALRQECKDNWSSILPGLKAAASLPDGYAYKHVVHQPKFAGHYYGDSVPHPTPEKVYNEGASKAFGGAHLFEHQIHHKGVPVGKLRYSMHPDEPHVLNIEGLAVHPDHQGSGLAFHLADHMQHHAESIGGVIDHGTYTDQGHAFAKKYMKSPNAKAHLHLPYPDAPTGTKGGDFLPSMLDPEEMKAGQHGRSASLSRDWVVYAGTLDHGWWNDSAPKVARRRVYLPT